MKLFYATNSRLILRSFFFNLKSPIFLEKYLNFNICLFNLNKIFFSKLPVNWKHWEIRNRRSTLIDKKMSENVEIAKVIEPLRKSVKEQGDLVRKLKEENASELKILKAVNELRARKKDLELKELEFLPNDNTIEKTRFDDLLKRRFYLTQSFEIYGGYSGQYDFGPMTCAIKQNILDLWRNHFLIEDDLFEIDCTIITPEPILKASGHVQKFSDYMVKDTVTGECFRLDHLIKRYLEDLKKNTKEENLNLEYENLLAKLDNLNVDELNDIKKKFEITSPITKNSLSEPIEFNLMFSTFIGPTGICKGYLRPETAQGIFVNFKRLLEFNQGKLPFGAAQIGQVFRNEISPRSGLLRVREFTLAEIEYFINPDESNHPKFENVKHLKLNLLSACNQMDGKSFEPISLEDSVNNKIINSETLAYFMGRIYLFLIKIGVDPIKLRFRQHMSNEMAHYARDCWDAECLTSYGWIECVGCADRSCFDLTQHTKATNIKLAAEKVLKNPKKVKTIECIPQKSVLGKLFKEDAGLIINKLSTLSESEIKDMQYQIEKTGSVLFELNGKKIKNFIVNEDSFKINNVEKSVYVEEIIPNVIEPSFGIGRILYVVLEHNFRQRDDELRTFFALPPEISPLKCSILPLVNNEEFKPFIKKIKKSLVDYNLSCKIDDGRSTIGKRYSRTDELSVPFNITIDFDTLKQPHTVTLRERDTMEQLRVPLDEVCEIVFKLSFGKEKWLNLKKIYPLFSSKNE